MLEKAIAITDEDSRMVAELRRQIVAKNSGQSAQDLYVTGAIKRAQPQQ
jgi:hypothetical protein